MKRTPEPVPIVPPTKWALWGTDPHDAVIEALAQRTLRVRVPKARRVGQRVDTQRGRLSLLWVADVSADITVIAAADLNDWGAVAFVLCRGWAVADFIPDIEAARTWRWHKRRVVENAKAMAAIIREHQPAPTTPAAEAWLRRQLDGLGGGWAAR